MRRQFLPILLVAATLASANPILAQGRGNGPKHKDKGKKADVHRGHDQKAPDVVVIDRERHRRVIIDYYNREALPPGLAKREELPPGLRKQLRERGTLPPGLQKRLVNVPDPLLRRLPSVPGHYGRYFVGRDFIVVDRQRNLILQIIPDVLPRR